MKNSFPTKEQIGQFVDAGSENLNNYNFVSEELNKSLKGSLKMARLSPAAVAESNKTDGDSEKSVQFRLNQTGNIFYSTSSPELQDETKKLFDSVTVLFAAMTKALNNKGKDLFDYDAWSKLIAGSGYFIEVSKYEKNLTIESNSVTIDTQIVQELIPGLTSGSSLEIAKSVLNALNGEYQTKKSDSSAKIGHLLFICEELFGAPSVTVRLFFASSATHTQIFSSPCVKTSSTSFEQLQEANTFLFVSPDTIAQFAGKFGDAPEAYNSLIDKLSGYIDG